MEALRSYLTNKKLGHLVGLTELPGWRANGSNRDHYYWPPGAGKQFRSYLAVAGYLEGLHEEQKAQATRLAAAGTLLSNALAPLTLSWWHSQGGPS